MVTVLFFSSNFSQGCFCIHGKWWWEWSEADGTRKPFDDNRAQSPLWGKGSLPSNKGELFMSPEMRSSPIHPFTSPAIYLSDPASLLMWSSSNFLVYWRNSGNSSPTQPARKNHMKNFFPRLLKSFSLGKPSITAFWIRFHNRRGPQNLYDWDTTVAEIDSIFKVL